MSIVVGDADLVLRLDDTGPAAVAGGAAVPRAAEPPVRGPELARLVGAARVEDFWERRPHLATGLDAFDDVFALDEVDRLVATGGLRLPSFRLLKDGRVLPTAQYTRPSGPGVQDLIDAHRTSQLVASGATLALLGLRAHMGSVDAFSAGLATTLGHRVHANAYLTPPGASGAGAHWDTHSVFIRQVSGAKRWRVQEPVEALPRRPVQRGEDLDTPLVGEWVLHPGDCLYLPRGFIHDGWAVADSPSVHITFGLREPVTWADLLADVVRGFADDQRLRDILPLGFPGRPQAVEQALTQHRDLLVARLGDLDLQDTADAIVRGQAHEEPAPARHRLASLMSGLDDAATVCAAAAGLHPAAVAGDGDRDAVEVRTPLGSLRAPAALAPVLTELLDGREHRLGDLATHLDPASARRLTQRLVQCGALVVR